MVIDRLKTVQVFNVVNAMIRQMPGPIPRGVSTCVWAGAIYDSDLSNRLSHHASNCIFSAWDTLEFLHNKVFVPFNELGLLDTEEFTMDELNLICELYTIFSAIKDMRDLCKSGYLKFTNDSIWVELCYYRCSESHLSEIVIDNRIFIKDSSPNFFTNQGKVQFSFRLPEGHKSSFVALIMALDRMLWKVIVSDNRSKKMSKLKQDISSSLWYLTEMLGKQESVQNIAVSN